MSFAAVRSRVVSFAVAVAAGPLGGTFTLPVPPIHAPVALEPPAVLARYSSAVAHLKRPKTVSFEFSVEQSGLRNLEQTHRVYRSGQSERDETLSADGVTLTSPSVRIFRTRANRYDVGALAPRVADYDFAFAGLARSGERNAYVFHTRRRAPSSYAVGVVVIDGESFLPLTIGFALGGNGVKAQGRMTFASSLGYWLIREASVDAVVSGKPARERIVFSKYAFPELPPSTFEVPHAAPSVLAPPEAAAGP